LLAECFNSPYGTKYFKQYAESIPQESDTNFYRTGIQPNGLLKNKPS
jgi:hypothetical protein